MRDEYHLYLCSLMAFNNGVVCYPKYVELSDADVISLTLNNITRQLKNIADNTSDPGPEDNTIDCWRSNLDQCKKSVYVLCQISTCLGTFNQIMGIPQGLSL